MASVIGNLDDIVAHMSGVVNAVHDKGKAIETKAKGRLAPHYYHGEAEIIGHAEDTDYVIALVDDAAMSIEFGHAAGVDASGRHYGAMTGLNILGGSI